MPRQQKANKRGPTTTVTPARLRVFQPTQRPTLRTGEWFEVPNRGKVRVTGRLGQKHADLLECIFVSTEDVRPASDGVLELIVDPARVRKMMSSGIHKYSHAQLLLLIKELRSAVVEISTKRIHTIGGLLDNVDEKADDLARDNHFFGKSKFESVIEKRKIWAVRLGVAMTNLLYADIKLFYDPTYIVVMQHGISQAVARLLLTHREHPIAGWIVDNAITAVAGTLSPVALRNRRRELRDDSDALRRAGFVLDGARLFSLEIAPK